MGHWSGYHLILDEGGAQRVRALRRCAFVCVSAVACLGAIGVARTIGHDEHAQVAVAELAGEVRLTEDQESESKKNTHTENNQAGEEFDRDKTVDGARAGVAAIKGLEEMAKGEVSPLQGIADLLVNINKITQLMGPPASTITGCLVGSMGILGLKESNAVLDQIREEFKEVHAKLDELEKLSQQVAGDVKTLKEAVHFNMEDVNEVIAVFKAYSSYLDTYAQQPNARHKHEAATYLQTQDLKLKHMMFGVFDPLKIKKLLIYKLEPTVGEGDIPHYIEATVLYQKVVMARTMLMSMQQQAAATEFGAADISVKKVIQAAFDDLKAYKEVAYNLELEKTLPTAASDLEASLPFCETARSAVNADADTFFGDPSGVKAWKEHLKCACCESIHSRNLSFKSESVTIKMDGCGCAAGLTGEEAFQSCKGEKGGHDLQLISVSVCFAMLFAHKFVQAGPGEL